MGQMREFSVRKTAIFVLFFLFPCFAWAATAEDPVALKTRGNNDVIVATQLVKQADTLLKDGLSPDSMKAAAALYAQAGPLFEKALKAYVQLGPDYVSADEIKACQNGMKYCMNSLKQLREHMPEVLRARG